MTERYYRITNTLEFKGKMNWKYYNISMWLTYICLQKPQLFLHQFISHHSKNLTKQHNKIHNTQMHFDQFYIINLSSEFIINILQMNQMASLILSAIYLKSFCTYFLHYWAYFPQLVANFCLYTRQKSFIQRNGTLSQIL